MFKSNLNGATYCTTNNSYNYFKLNVYDIWCIESCIISVHYGTVGEGDVVGGCYSMLGVDVAEEVQSGVNFHNLAEELFVAVVDVVIKVEDAAGRRVGDEHVGVGGDAGDVAPLTI